MGATQSAEAPLPITNRPTLHKPLLSQHGPSGFNVLLNSEPSAMPGGPVSQASCMSMLLPSTAAAVQQPHTPKRAKSNTTRRVGAVGALGGKSIHQAGHGVHVLRHHDPTKADKLLEYSPEELEERPWFMGIWATVRQASVLFFPSVVRGSVVCIVIAMAAAAASLLFEKGVIDTFVEVRGTVSSGLFFLLGPYVGLAIARWWQMRMDLLGGVWGAISDLNMYATTWFSSGSKADRAARELVLRYGLAAHTLLYKAARRDESLDSLVDSGLLLKEEAEVLAPLPSKSQMVFAWLFDFWSRALRDDSGGLGTSPVPHAQNQAPVVLKRIQDGRGAAGGALAVVFTQIPFPYVHLLAMLVQSCCVINAVCEGVRLGWMLSEPVCVDGAEPPASHLYRYEFQAGCPPALFVWTWCATAMLVFGSWVSVVLYPVMFHGLLSVGIMLDNTLGTDFIDFPGTFYQHIMKAEIKGFAACIDASNDWIKKFILANNKPGSSNKTEAPDAASRVSPQWQDNDIMVVRDSGSVNMV